MKSLSPSCFKCQIMLDISISPRRASVKSSWTLLKVLKLPSAPPVASNRSDSVLSWVWNVIIVTALHNWHSEEAPNVSIFMDGLHNQLCNRAQRKRCAQPIAAQVGDDRVWWLVCGLCCTVSGNSGCLPLVCGLFHMRFSMLCVCSQKVLSPLEICRRNL